ncbi:MAG: N-6 DNA methylase [Desulfobacterales bacterium]|nr:N-6 DNA methylase [Desulfobacterales bacterium]
MKRKAILKDYFKTITDVASKGDAREESFYSCLEALFQQFATSTGRSEAHVTTLPKKTEAGNPDFRVWNGQDQITGYIEAKKPTEENLDHIASTDQLNRYRQTFPNLILTNFFEFFLFRNGQLVDRVLAARPFVLHKLGTVPPVEKGKELFNLLEKFFSFSLPKSYTAQSLAVELAKRTRFLRDVVADELREEKARKQGVLLGFYEAFQKYLIANLTMEDFADLYAQTITYGLFAARTRSGDGPACHRHTQQVVHAVRRQAMAGRFNRRMAFDNIPRTIGILRDVFQFISLGDLPNQLEWIVDDISGVLAVADAGGILDRFYHEGKGSDPIVHFYETFLAEYDPEERERRGVYYTPEPVVSYIVRSLHQLLKTKFDRSDGLASDGVTLLDPGAGTMTFVARACQEAVREFEDKYGAGGREGFIREHILKNFYAFELMMAPYAVGHLKMSFFLEELGHRLGDDERFQFYLTNTLEMEELEQTSLPGMSSLAEESHLAGKVKKERPILVILGNPPYSGISANPSEKYIITTTRKGKERRKKVKTWIGNLIEDYKYVDGKHFGERKHWLQDDYVKFIRFAQWRIDQTGEGILGFITNHSYLDNPTFRGMRQSLMNSFNEIYILDLHGSSLKKEKCPDGSKDENVFDIQQGVAISLFIKKRGEKKKSEVYHSQIWGLWKYKYDRLWDENIETTNWEKLRSASPYYFFVPREEKGREIYHKYWKITDIFPVNVTGIVTARDKFVIDRNRQSLEVRIRTFIDEKNTDDYIKEYLRSILGRKNVKDVENYAWRVSKSRQELRKVENLKDCFTKILYRPFDIREIFFHDSVVWRTRKEVMRHMLAGKNVGLITSRQVLREFRHVFVANRITNFNSLDTAGRFGSGYLFPLYLYPDTSKMDLFSHLEASAERKPNLEPKLIAALKSAYGKKPAPKDIFCYIYAVLYAKTYREKYAQFLKIDFPRIPFTTDFKLFQSLAALGKRLVDLHLLRSEELDPPVARFQGQGDDRVARTKSKGFLYEPKEERVRINKTQYFEPVPLELWEYQIGGYQVLAKWLKDRRDRVLSLEEIKTYCRIVTSIQRTIALQEEIDALYPQAEAKIVKIGDGK